MFRRRRKARRKQVIHAPGEHVRAGEHTDAGSGEQRGLERQQEHKGAERKSRVNADRDQSQAGQGLITRPFFV